MLALVVIAVVFVELLPRIADYGDVWGVVARLSPLEIAALATMTTINLATFAPPWMAAIPGLGYWNATVLTQVSTALSIAVPGGDAAGIAASYAMLRGWGFGRRTVAVAVVVTGVGNQLVNVLLPLVALALLVTSGGSSPLLLTAGLIGIAAILGLTLAVVLVLRGERQARAVGERAQSLANHVLDLLHRPARQGWGDGLVQFRRETIDLVARRWAALAGSLLLGHLTVFGVLMVALRATGVGADEVGWVEALAAWGLIRLLSAVPITPAGVGIVELGLSSALVGFGAHNAQAVAAVLLYRALTVLPTLALGAILGVTWRRHGVALEGGCTT
ncbi:MAG TPA: lysylphosphatidylglycerol synthase transmembrane domain-containing protein [Gaiellales bacterium]|nr:lysylphosphatidylglycerol synthase transmembrane domain-containing protein [Gaiellales bacterium]